jgi:hypothetical protein
VRNLEECSRVNWLTQPRKLKGTRACRNQTVSTLKKSVARICLAAAPGPTIRWAARSFLPQHRHNTDIAAEESAKSHNALGGIRLYAAALPGLSVSNVRACCGRERHAHLLLHQGSRRAHRRMLLNALSSAADVAHPPTRPPGSELAASCGRRQRGRPRHELSKRPAPAPTADRARGQIPRVGHRGTEHAGLQRGSPGTLRDRARR